MREDKNCGDVLFIVVSSHSPISSQPTTTILRDLPCRSSRCTVARRPTAITPGAGGGKNKGRKKGEKEEAREGREGEEKTEPKMRDR